MNKRETKINKDQKEIGNLLKIVGLEKIEDGGPRDIYTFTNLEGQKRRLIRMMILEDYLQIDSKMSILVTDFLFHHCQKEYEDMLKVTTSKEYLVFTDKLLKEMPFLRKVAVIKGFLSVPSDIVSGLNKINDLRNAIAHALIPESLGEERVLYKGELIFSLKGAKLFNKDTTKIMTYLQKHFTQAFENNKKLSKA
jgi:hypothetical protein